MNRINRILVNLAKISEIQFKKVLFPKWETAPAKCEETLTHGILKNEMEI